MTIETRTVKSTSKQSATTDDIVLRETTTTRLVFRPTLVTNANNSEASVKGAFLFQRKGSSDKWEDIKATPLSSLKKHEEYKLPVSSSELLTFHSELNALYELYHREGIPLGETRFIKANRTIQAVAQMTDEELMAVVKGSRFLGAQAFARLIRWASDADNFSVMFERLQSLDPNSLLDLNAALGIATLKRALKIWLDNRSNGDEEYWQQLFSSQSFVLEQLFCLPIVVIQSKAYVGGKSINNRGGHVVDFLINNQVTNAIGIIEIKTPKTSLLGEEYRAGVYNVSKELSGAVLQVLNYRESLRGPL